MAQACSENAGKILLRNQIISRSPFSPNEPHICIHLRNNWTWQELSKVSAKTFKKHIEHITNNIAILINNQNQTIGDLNIEIKKCPFAGANGIWIPTSEGDQISYVKQSDSNRWLYLTQPVGSAPPNSLAGAQWWLGTKDNKIAKKAWGWVREMKPAGNNDKVELWNVSKWKYYSDDTKKWTNADVMEVTVITKEIEIKRMIKERTKALKETCDDKVCEYQNKMKNAEIISTEHRQASKLLFNNLNKEDRIKLIDKTPFRRIFKIEDLCSVCFASEKTTKCVHADCTGACANCRGENQDAKCCACNKEQILECPVCMENYPPSFINRFSCRHGVCWRCFSQSYVAKKPIIKCPMCRKNI